MNNAYIYTCVLHVWYTILLKWRYLSGISKELVEKERLRRETVEFVRCHEIYKPYLGGWASFQKIWPKKRDGEEWFSKDLAKEEREERRVEFGLWMEGQIRNWRGSQRKIRVGKQLSWKNWGLELTWNIGLQTKNFFGSVYVSWIYEEVKKSNNETKLENKLYPRLSLETNNP